MTRYNISPVLPLNSKKQVMLKTKMVWDPAKLEKIPSEPLKYTERYSLRN